jgi:hydrogenase/urease accessory protein HupE
LTPEILVRGSIREIIIFSIGIVVIMLFFSTRARGHSATGEPHLAILDTIRSPLSSADLVYAMITIGIFASGMRR